MRDLQADLDEFNHWMYDKYDTYGHALIWFIRVLPEAINRAIKAEAENALLRKVEEVGEIMWSEAVCHRCAARECRGCSAHDFKQALSEYQSWKEGQELDKEGER